MSRFKVACGLVLLAHAEASHLMRSSRSPTSVPTNSFQPTVTYTPTHKPTEFPTTSGANANAAAQALMQSAVIAAVMAFVGLLLGFGNLKQDSDRRKKKVLKVMNRTSKITADQFILILVKSSHQILEYNALREEERKLLLPSVDDSALLETMESFKVPNIIMSLFP
jgi:4-aminobutyrate aminotransferase-like enzyme